MTLAEDAHDGGDDDSGRPRPARIKDVAALAGVSLKTVTNVVHDRPYVRDDTRARVQAAIDALGYRPSLAGRVLQSGRSNTLTLAVPRVDEPYLGALAHAMITAAASRGYTVLIDETGGRAAQEEQAASGYPGHGIDGVIFSPAALNPERMVQMSRDTPMVLLGEHLPESTADHVAIDNVESARDVVRHFAEAGRTRIAFLGYQPDNPHGVGGLRYAGYRAEAATLGLEVRPEWLIGSAHFTRAEGEAAINDILPRLTEVDALLCGSDLLAIGAMRALRTHGVRVPEDLALVGWDNIDEGAYHSPALSSVAPDLARLAELTLDALLRRIDGDRAPGRSYPVPHRLIVRESSG